MSFKSDNGVVLIIGGGPSGAATAIALSELKIPCAVIDCQQEGEFKPGESLAPNVNPLLKRLRIESILREGGHNRWHGNEVVWGSNKIEARYFIKEAFGNGWHLDRMLFEKQLRSEAESRGVNWMEKCRFSTAERIDGKLQVEVIDQNGSYLHFETPFLVDCSGRKSSVARKMEVRKRTMDNLIAYCVTAHVLEQALKGISFIEAVRDGWWYAAPLQHNKIILNFITDSDLQKVQPTTMAEWFREKITETKYLRKQTGICLDADIEVKVRTATTSYIERPAGKDWLALGDAMCSFDPLTSFGLTKSLSDSINAAAAIKEVINGDIKQLFFFIDQQQRRFNKAMSMLVHQYQLEQRWPSEIFWKRRHNAVASS